MRRTIAAIGGPLVAAALLVILVAVAYPSTKLVTQADQRVSCDAPVNFLGVRGSGETAASAGGYGGVAPFRIALTAELRPLALRTEPIDYQAIDVFPALVNIGQNLYPKSYQHGREQLINTLYLSQRQCPNQRLVLAGFSQGAHAVGDVVAALDPRIPTERAILDRVDAVVLFGDPIFNPADRVVDVHPDTRHLAGVLATFVTGWGFRVRPVHQASLAPRVHSFCLKGDPICNAYPPAEATALAKCAVAKRNPAVCPHFGYAEDAASAAAWAATRVRTALSSGASPSTTLAPSSTAPSTTGPPSTTRSTIPPTRPPTTAVPVTTRPPVTAQDPHAPPVSDPGQPPLPPGAITLGGLSLEDYCQQWDRHAALRYPVAWGWQCGYDPTLRGWRAGDLHLSVDDACEQQYGSGTKSHYRSYTDPYSWFCFKPGG